MKNLIALLALALLVISCTKPCPENPAGTSNNGCGDFMLFEKLAIDRFAHSYITFNAQRDKLDLTEEYKTFDIAATPEITSRLEAFNTDNSGYCNCFVGQGVRMLNEWTLISGSVQIKIVRDRNECSSNYVVDVILTHAVYEDAKDNVVNINYHHFKNVLVGWYAG